MNWATNVGVIVSAYITVSVVGAYIIRAILKRYEVDRGVGGLKSAGMAIGIIERVMVLTFVLVDQYTAITVIFAAKSIARFNELEDRNMAEYYLIGTLLSITSALIIGIITKLTIEGGMI
ncbi:MAG: hypothetical protein U9N12_02975 [Euryarchaeota archaeon]|nr:hypothetical protein [Euryarchaeota archaeon]